MAAVITRGTACVEKPINRNAAFFLELTRDLQTAAAPHPKIQHFLMVDPVQAKQVNVLELQVVHRLY